MADITEVTKYEGWNGEIKELVVKANETPSTGETYDTNADAADGRGAEFREIFDAKYVTSTGSEHVDCSFVQSTGIVTLGTISTPTEEGTLTIRGRQIKWQQQP